MRSPSRGFCWSRPYQAPFTQVRTLLLLSHLLLTACLLSSCPPSRPPFFTLSLIYLVSRTARLSSRPACPALLLTHPPLGLHLLPCLPLSRRPSLVLSAPHVPPSQHCRLLSHPQEQRHWKFVCKTSARCGRDDHPDCFCRTPLIARPSWIPSGR
jgi:hypothetical protein